MVHRAITRFLLDQAGLKPGQADSGAVTLIQRFGSAANLNIHLHCLVLYGAYRRTAGDPVFVEVPAPIDEALQALLHKIISRLMKLLTWRGVLVNEEGSVYLAGSDVAYRIAFGPRAGQKVVTVQGALPRDAAFTQALCADVQGFSLHAAVRCAADDRQALEQLCRYITHPALANERVQINITRQMVLRLKTPWRDGTTHMVMSPLEFIQLGLPSARSGHAQRALGLPGWDAVRERGQQRCAALNLIAHPGLPGLCERDATSVVRLSTDTSNSGVCPSHFSFRIAEATASKYSFSFQS